MDELISKKELLEITEISYGQLYRWKRKNLIPEEWFIKTSSFTGQETFFPREKVLQRVQKILELKDSLSLDELAEYFSPKGDSILISSNEISSLGIISFGDLEIYKETFKIRKDFNFKDIVFLFIFKEIRKNIKATKSIEFIKALKNVYNEIEGKKYFISIFEEENVILHEGNIMFLSDYKKINTLDILYIIEKIKEKLF